MRRPVCLMAAAFAAGIFFGFYAKWLAAGIVSAALCSAIFIWRKGRRENRFQTYAKTACIFAAFFLLGAFFLWMQEAKTDPLLAMTGQRTTVAGKVCSVEKIEEEKFRLVLKTAEGSKVLIGIYGKMESFGSGKGYGDLAGRWAEAQGQLERPAERRNPRCFDYRAYLMTKGIGTTMNIAPRSLTVGDEVISRAVNLLSNLKCDFVRKMAGTTGSGTTGMLPGMLFGDKQGMDEEVYELFQKNGTAHILAVSGLHVGIVYWCAGRLIRAGHSPFRNGVLLFLLLTYAALASFSPAVMRAGGMIVQHILSKLLHRRYDLLCGAAVTGTAMLAVNPMSLFDPGFQLSFLAILTITFVLPAVNRICTGAAAASFAIQLGMIPVTAYSFNCFSLGAFLVNIPVIFLSGILIPLGMLLIPLSCFSEALFSIGAKGADLLCTAILAVNQIACVPGVTFFPVVSPPLFWVLAYCGGLFWAASESAFILFARKERKRLLAAAAVILLFCGMAAFPIRDDFHKARLVFVDVGQGDCLHIRTPGGKNILVDGGGNANYDVGKKILIPYLLKNGVRKLDMVFVSHRHLDHYGGILSLARHFRVEKLCFYEANKVIEGEILAETGLAREQLVYLSKGQQVRPDRGVEIEVLYPDRRPEAEYADLLRKGADENAVSLILKIHCDGVTVLMTGDIDDAGEKRLIAAYPEENDTLKVDIVKAPHHGSRFGSSRAFVERTGPRAAVFQVGKNNFGHPTAEALAAYEEQGAQIFRNDRHGAIGVFLQNGKGKKRAEKKMIFKTIVLEKNAGE